MFKIIRQIQRIGIITEAVPTEPTLAELGIVLKQQVTRYFHGSFAIRAVDAGSCNGCELEIHALNNAFYDIERFGVHFVASPRHADALLVTGPITQHMAVALQRTYNALPDPKWVMAMGHCPINGGEFGASYACLGDITQVVPVALTIPGCPPTPETLLRGILTLITSNPLGSNTI